MLNGTVVRDRDARSGGRGSQASVALVLRSGSCSDAATSGRVNDAGSAVVVAELSAGEAGSNTVLTIGELAERTSYSASNVDVEAAVRVGALTRQNGSSRGCAGEGEDSTEGLHCEAVVARVVEMFQLKVNVL